VGRQQVQNRNLMGEMKAEGRYPHVQFHGEYFKGAVKPFEVRKLWLDFYMVDPRSTQRDEIMCPSRVPKLSPRDDRIIIDLECLSNAAYQQSIMENQWKQNMETRENIQNIEPVPQTSQSVQPLQQFIQQLTSETPQKRQKNREYTQAS